MRVQSFVLKTEDDLHFGSRRSWGACKLSWTVTWATNTVKKLKCEMAQSWPKTFVLQILDKSPVHNSSHIRECGKMARSHSTDTIYTQMTLFSHCLQHALYRSNAWRRRPLHGWPITPGAQFLALNWRAPLLYTSHQKCSQINTVAWCTSDVWLQIWVPQKNNEGRSQSLFPCTRDQLIFTIIC